MINCLIIDDEPLALDLIETFVKKIPFLSMHGRCSNPLEALPLLAGNEIDVLFLDVRMPDISGIDFVKSLSVKPRVVFTSAHCEYAVECFDLNAVDYLLKPFSFERFISTANRLKELVEPAQARSSGAARSYFFINASHKIQKICYDEILFLEGYKDYTKIYLRSQQNPMLILQNVSYFEKILPPDEFIRIHRSYIVSISKLSTITKKSVTVGSSSMPVSNSYRERLFQMIA